MDQYRILKYSRVKGTLNPLSANLTKWPNTLKHFVGKLPTNCLSVFAHFEGLALEGLKDSTKLLAKLTTDIRNLSITQAWN